MVGDQAQRSGMKYPFWLCAFDERSLRAYSARFLQCLRSTATEATKPTLANLSFQVFRQSNRSLENALIFRCSSINELEEKLSAFTNGEKSISAIPRQQALRPVVLCFGGQISTYVGLDREVFDNTKILRHYLDQCDKVFLSLGLESVYLKIFQKKAIDNIITLQVILFALQYSCAKSWIDCGVEIAAIVGHSFGEITALCISGVLLLQDTVKLIAGRARVVEENWGLDKGSMMAVETDLGDVEKLLSELGKHSPGDLVNIACFNGPRSFTLAGSTKAIELLREIWTNNGTFSSSMRIKKLDVTNAFHSILVEPLMSSLDNIGQELVFKGPRIPIERATKANFTGIFDRSFVTSHIREPVYFDQAVQRMSQRYPSSIWLVAGSNSTITIMASRALSSPHTSHFQPTIITSNGAFHFLTDVTRSLWKEGLKFAFWPHHAIQTPEYDPLLLPPY